MLRQNSAGFRPEQESGLGFRTSTNRNKNRNVQPSTPRTQCPTPRAQRPTQRTKQPIKSYTKLGLAFQPNPNPMSNSSSPTPSSIEAPLQLQFLFGSSKQELHHSQAGVWWRPLKSSTSQVQLSFRLRIRIQAILDTRADLQKPSDMEPNEASSQTGIKVAPSAP